MIIISKLNIDVPHPIPDSLKKSLEQQQFQIKEITKSATESIAKIELPKFESLTDNVDCASPLAQIADQFSCYQLIPDITSAIREMSNSMLENISVSIQSVADSLTEAMENALSPFVEWLNSFDFSPLRQIFEDLSLDLEPYKKYAELNKAYLQAMYDCDWFPYAGWIADISLFQQINEILATSRGKSKRRTTRIDKAILSYYTTKEIRAIKHSWRTAELEPHIKKMLGHAVEAHIRGEYALTISCLATMWDGLLRSKMPAKKRKSDELKNDIKELVADNGFEEILGDFYNNLIIHTCYSVNDVKDGIPNRHEVAHSWYKKYPNKKASLNAILLTDFIIGLSPKEIQEA